MTQARAVISLSVLNHYFHLCALHLVGCGMCNTGGNRDCFTFRPLADKPVFYLCATKENHCTSIFELVQHRASALMPNPNMPNSILYKNKRSKAASSRVT